MERIIFHIDVNSAYLSWSALDRLASGDTLDLRTIPSIIGGDRQKRHGVVLAKSIPAKKYGVQTGEPIVNALRKCPNLVIEAPDHASYAAYSGKFTQFLYTICPDIEKVSIDECYLDFTTVRSRYSSPEAAADFIRGEILRRFGFTVNIGISDRKVLAKMASDFQKPNRVHTLYHTQIQEKMWPMPVSSLFMCGRSSADVLHKLGILTIGDLAQADPAILESHLKSHGRLLWEYANGLDHSVIVTEPYQAKGIGNSITLRTDADTRAKALPALRSLAESVAARLRESRQSASLISTEIKYSDFSTVSHQTLLSSPTNTSEAIYHTACILFDEIWNGSPVRLLGIRTSKLSDAGEPVQMNLFDYTQKNPDSLKQQNLDRAIDEIRKKFGQDSIVRGSLFQHTNDYKKH